MNLSQLEAFVATCEEANYSRAAQILYMSQPALHHKVKQLESALGVPLLFVRDRRVVPTAEGDLLLEAAKKIVDDVHELQRRFQDMTDTKTVRIGSASLLGTTLLPKLIEICSSTLAGINIQFVATNAWRPIELFLNKSVDIALTWESQAPAGVQVEPFISCEIVCAAHPGHPLIDGNVHSPSELQGFPWTLTDRGEAIRDAIDLWWREVASSQAALDIFTTSNDALAAQVAAMSRRFITFLPAPLLEAYRLAPVVLSGALPRISTVVCYSAIRGQRRAVQDVLRVLRAWQLNLEQRTGGNGQARTELFAVSKQQKS